MNNLKHIDINIIAIHYTYYESEYICLIGTLKEQSVKYPKNLTNNEWKWHTTGETININCMYLIFHGSMKLNGNIFSIDGAQQALK